MIIVLFLLLMTTVAMADPISNSVQVQKHLKDVGKISSMTDESLYEEYKVFDSHGHIFIKNWNEGVLGTQPVSWPSVASAKAELAADIAALPKNVEKASLVSDLTNAVFQTFGLMPPYSQNAQDTYKQTLRTQMKTYRTAVDNATSVTELKDAQKELNLRQQIINLVREIKGLDSGWTLGDVQ